MSSADQKPASYVATLLAVVLASFLLPLAVTAPSAALPEIGRSLHAAPVATQWLVNAYAIAFAAAVMAAGSIADRFGRRRVMRAGTAMFAAASALIAISPSVLFVDALRVPEAIGTAAILASGAAVLSHAATGPRRDRAFGLLGASFGSGLALGPVIAGVLIPLGWRGIFALTAGLALVAWLLGGRAAESRNPAGHPVDVPGMVVFSGALLVLSIALIEAPYLGWTSAPTLALLASAAGLVAVFCIIELRRRAPMFDVRLFSRPAFVAVTCQPFTITFGFVILIVFLPPFVQRAADLSVLSASALLLPLTAPVLVLPLTAARLLATLGIRGTLVAASALIAIGCGLLTQIAPDADIGSLAPGLLVFGTGVGAAFGVMDNAAVGAVPVEQSGIASGMFNTMRLTGEAVAIAAAGAALTSLTASHLNGASRLSAAAAVQGRINGSAASAAVASSLHVVVLALGALAAIGALSTFLALRERPTASPEGSPTAVSTPSRDVAAPSR